MDKSQNPPQPPYPGYNLFVIEERNGRPQNAGPQWRITAATADETLEDPAYPRYRTRHTELGQAVDQIRDRLQARRQALLEEAQGCQTQLEQLDAFYVPQLSPGQHLAAQRDKLVELLRSFKAERKPGRTPFQGFSVALPYMETTDLFVVSLPEYNAISPRFLESDVKLLTELLAEAGYGTCSTWNGAGCYSVSFRLSVATEPASTMEEAVL